MISNTSISQTTHQAPNLKNKKPMSENIDAINQDPQTSEQRGGFLSKVKNFLNYSTNNNRDTHQNNNNKIEKGNKNSTSEEECNKQSTAFDSIINDNRFSIFQNVDPKLTYDYLAKNHQDFIKMTLNNLITHQNNTQKNVNELPDKLCSFLTDIPFKKEVLDDILTSLETSTDEQNNIENENSKKFSRVLKKICDLKKSSNMVNCNDFNDFNLYFMQKFTSSVDVHKDSFTQSINYISDNYDYYKVMLDSKTIDVFYSVIMSNIDNFSKPDFDSLIESMNKLYIKDEGFKEILNILCNKKIELYPSFKYLLNRIDELNGNGIDKSNTDNTNIEEKKSDILYSIISHKEISFSSMSSLHKKVSDFLIKHVTIQSLITNYNKFYLNEELRKETENYNNEKNKSSIKNPIDKANEKFAIFMSLFYKEIEKNQKEDTPLFRLFYLNYTNGVEHYTIADIIEILSNISEKQLYNKAGSALLINHLTYKISDLMDVEALNKIESIIKDFCKKNIEYLTSLFNIRSTLSKRTKNPFKKIHLYTKNLHSFFTYFIRNTLLPKLKITRNPFKKILNYISKNSTIIEK